MDVASPPQARIAAERSDSDAAATVVIPELATKFFAADGPRPAGPRGSRHPSAQGQGRPR